MPLEHTTFDCPIYKVACGGVICVLYSLLSERLNERSGFVLYELTVRGTYAGQQTINRWHYLSSGVPAAVLGSFGLASAFGVVGDAGALPANTVFAAIRDLVSTSWTCQSVEVRAASNYAPSDFYERPFTIVVGGAVAGDPTAPFLAYGFRTSRVRLDIARATKRFAGVSEDSTVAGGTFVAGTLTKLSTLATRMSAVLSYNDEGNTISYSPAVVKKERYINAKGKPSYRYLPTLAEQLADTATGFSWSAYQQVRSQVSRQVGRGI